MFKLSNACWGLSSVVALRMWIHMANKAILKQANQVWSMDFMSDALADGRTLGAFNVVDDYNCEGLGIEVDLSLPSARVISSLERIIEWRGKPDALRCDNGPEYISQTLVDWANERQITFIYTQPSKPTQNAYIERFNRTARHEWLDLHLFESVENAQNLATEWLWTYNNMRPHSAIGGVPPRRLIELDQPSTFRWLWKWEDYISISGKGNCYENEVSAKPQRSLSKLLPHTQSWVDLSTNLLFYWAGSYLYILVYRGLLHTTINESIQHAVIYLR